jgi:arylsulfatase A-like enzyme
VPWITVFFNHNIRGQDEHPELADEYGWDTHNDIFEAMREHLLPRFDLGFSALLEDLEQRGLLHDTLVVCMGEFGRAPLVALEKTFKGGTPGRKHWPRCYSVVLAGAGVHRGAVYGSSDRHGASPQSNPVTPGDLAATMFDALGIEPETHFPDLNNRPYRVTTGNPIRALFG